MHDASRCDASIKKKRITPEEGAKRKQATNIHCFRDEIARTATRTLLHGGMSPEKSYHTQKRAPDRNKPRAGGRRMEQEWRQTTVVATEPKLSNM